MSVTELPYAHGGPLGRAVLRREPEDFQVEELLGFPLTGEGEHLFLRVRKRNWTTDAVARRLARVLGVGAGAVSFAGMKDRRAVTTQWYSVHLPGSAATLPIGPLEEGVEVLEARRHNKKLRRGVLTGNRFRLRLRDVAVPQVRLSQRLVAVAHQGVPNYFGEQRFGRDGDNVAQARAMLAGERRVHDRGLRGMLLSAARSHLFNEVLAERLRRGDWNRGLPGELLMLDGRHSLFGAETIDETLRRRLAALELHPTGPLAGDGGPVPGPAVAALEAAVLAPHAELVAGLGRARVEAARRALRLRVAELAWWQPAADQLELGFALTAGAYATVVVRELFEVEEPRAGNG